MFKLTDLPYSHDALAPTISAETLRTHHGKHHAKYVEVLNQLLAEHQHGPFGTLEEVVRHAAANNEQKLFNNAGQTWNHSFFWESMTPSATPPEGELLAAIDRDLGGLDKLREQFVSEGASHFASGWVWLVLQGDRLAVISTHDADNVLTRDGVAPLLLCDVWEHAYYLDYKQDRKTFLETWFDKVANWRFAAEQLDAARAGRPGWRYPPPVAG